MSGFLAEQTIRETTREMIKMMFKKDLIDLILAGKKTMTSRASIPICELLEVVKCKKCGKVIAEPKA